MMKSLHEALVRAKGVVLLCCLVLVWAAPTLLGRDFVLVLDYSSSMTENDGLGLRREMSCLAIDSALKNDRVAVVVFAASHFVAVPLTPTSDEAKGAICDAIPDPRRPVRMPGGSTLPDGTDLIGALQATGRLLPQLGREAEVIFLTDGIMNQWKAYGLADDRKDQSRRTDLLDQTLKPFAAAGVPIHAIALGRQANTELLRTVSLKTDGQYFALTSAAELPQTYVNLLASGKGMVAVTGTSFYVWPGAQELDVVLFKTALGQKAAIERIFGPSREVVPGSPQTYWSRVRSERPSFYDFVRVSKPEGGDMGVVTSGRGQMQVHALQEAPFEFQIIVPARDAEKIVLGGAIEFRARLQPRAGVTPEVVETIAQSTEVTATLRRPDDSTRPLRKFRRQANASFVSDEPLTATEQGEYQLHLKALFRSPKGSAWTFEQNRLFRVAAADFALRLTTPTHETSLASPLDALAVGIAADKLDPQSEFNTPPEDTIVRLEIFGDGGQPLVQAEEGWAKAVTGVKLGDGQGLLLAPGRYRLRLAASHSRCSFRAAEVALRVHDWPAPVVTGGQGLKATLEWIDAAKCTPGESLRGSIQIKGPQGSRVPIGSRLPGDPFWVLQRVTGVSLTIMEPVGESVPVTVTTSPSGEPAISYRPRWSGEYRATGSVELALDLQWRGKSLHSRSVSLALEPAKFDAPDRVGLSPEQLRLAADQVARPCSQPVVLTSWFAKETALALRIDPCRLGEGELALPAEWCAVPPLRISPAPRSGGAGGTTNTATVTIGVPASMTGTAKFGNYRGRLVVCRPERPQAVLAEADVSFMLNVEWPDANDFTIRHDVPSRFGGETSILVFEDRLSPTAEQSKAAGSTNKFSVWLQYTPEPGSRLVKGALVAGRFRVEEIEWAWPEPWGRFREETDERAPYAVLGVFESREPIRARLSVARLVLTLMEAPTQRREYHNLEGELETRCSPNEP